LFTLIIGLLFFRIQVKWINVAGVITGLFGAIGLISVSGGHNFNFNFNYSLLVILATLLYAFNTNFIKSVLREIDALSITVFAMLFTGLIAIVWVCFFSDIPLKINHFPEKIKGLYYIGFLGLIGTGLAMLLFNYMIKLTSAVFAASVTYLMPVVAILWGIIDNEVIGLSQLLWIILILAGVLMVNTKSSRIFIKLQEILFRSKQ